MSSIDPEKFIEARKLGKKYMRYILSRQEDKAAELKKDLENRDLYKWAFPRPATTLIEEEFKMEPLSKGTFELTREGRLAVTDITKLDKPLRGKKDYFLLTSMPVSSQISYRKLKSDLNISENSLTGSLAELIYRGLVNKI